ncbi:TIGR04282 family arsenosugar biosynthesis glycosyltransferase [Leptospira ilyithenensis]|uniref:Glycosyltransferase n=1 Tax=Leptospira ilyithenensis TaxID=2484901 RepID=A0A4R9LMG9_9LEPT|nr:TIGR04282 family arsenosugar biosynthesis glycosyltransferase [Leptospira ilyithenensis]TGN07160.1 glycosyltransferase [Leptospira ilyithenensis]
MEERALIIFAKNPRLGKVKTRLAEGLGEILALEVYIELLRITDHIIRSLPVTKYIYWDGGIPENQNYFSEDCIHRKQVNGDLGLKMGEAFSEVLKEHSLVCIIGTDCPYLSSEILVNAYENLAGKADYVIGPALDGGYYLLGLKKVFTGLFQDMVWSTDKVYETTVKRGENLNLSSYILRELGDIDSLNDYKNWKGI